MMHTANGKALRSKTNPSHSIEDMGRGEASVSRSWLPSAACIVVILVLSAIYFADIFLPVPAIYSTHEIGVNDNWHFNFPSKLLLAKAFSAFRFPLWTDAIGGGFPVFAEGASGALNIYNLIAYTALPPIIAYNLGYFLIFAFNMIGMYLFARTIKMSRFASLFSAVTYGFSGYFVTHISHYTLIHAAGYLGWILYAIERYRARPSTGNVLFLSFLISQQIFAGFMQAVFMTVLTGGIYLAYHVWRKHSSVGVLAGFVAAVLFSAVLSAVQLLPSWELVGQSQRQSGASESDIIYYKYTIADLAMMVKPFVWGDPRIGTFPHFRDNNGSLFWENSGYMGLLPLAFSALWIFFKKRKKTESVWIIILGLSVLLMLGGGGPFYFILMMPPFSFFRFSARYLLVFLFSLAVLGGFGFDSLLGRIRKFRNPVGMVFLVIAIADLALIWFNYHPTVPFTAFAKDPAVVQLFPSRSDRFFSYKPNQRLFAQFQVSDTNKNPKFLELRNDMIPDSNIVYGLPSANFYTALSPKRMAFYGAILGDSYSLSATPSASLPLSLVRMLNLRAVRTVLSPIKLTNPELRASGTYRYQTLPRQEAYVYRNAAALPKYKAYREFKTVAYSDDVYTILSDPDHDIGQTAMIESEDIPKAVAKNGKPGFRVDPLVEMDGEVQLNVNADSVVFLSIANTYDPGWHAWVDGKPTRMYPVNLINQGILVQAGAHAVVLKYEPDSFRIGAAVSAVSYAFLIGYCLLRLLNRKKIRYDGLQ
jgi:hypothetical protein